MADLFVPALIIFVLRLFDYSLATLRLLMVIQGRKGLTWLFGFVQAAIFATAAKIVFADLGNWVKISGYAAGFASGNVMGIWLESRLSLGYKQFTIISTSLGAGIADCLRNAGFGVTQVAGRGMNGSVDILYCNALRKELGEIEGIVRQIDDAAFVTAEHIYPLRGGLWHHLISKNNKQK